MEDALRPCAVVGEEEKAGRVRVETPDRIETPALADELANGPATVRIADGAHDIDRLIQREIAARARERDRAPVDADARAGRDTRPELAHDLAIGDDPTFDDERLGGASRRDAAFGQHLLQPN